MFINYCIYAELNKQNVLPEKKMNLLIIRLFNFLHFIRLDDVKELDLSLYGLDSNEELESLQGLLHGDATSIKTLSDVRSYLATVYCGSMAVDFSAIEVIKKCIHLNS